MDERKHLTGREVDKLLAAVKGARPFLRRSRKGRCPVTRATYRSLMRIGGQSVPLNVRVAASNCTQEGNALPSAKVTE